VGPVDQVSSNRDLFSVFLRFEPLTKRPGSKTTARKKELRNALVQHITEDELNLAREKIKDRLVKIFVGFSLWKTPPVKSDTRWIKDLDNLLKMLLDVLGSDKQGLHLFNDDTYICEIQASKQLVAQEEEEGYLIRIREHKDDDMLRSLNESFSKRKKSTGL